MIKEILIYSTSKSETQNIANNIMLQRGAVGFLTFNLKYSKEMI